MDTSVSSCLYVLMTHIDDSYECCAICTSHNNAKVCYNMATSHFPAGTKFIIKKIRGNSIFPFMLDTDQMNGIVEVITI